MTNTDPTSAIKNADISNVTLSDEQEKLFDIFESSNDHLFITGKAGTGKSILLQYCKEHTEKNVLVVAPTGVAALNVKGQTIHSLFGIPPIFLSRENVGYASKKTAELLCKADTIVVDEISMVRADLMDAMDIMLRRARKNPEPFGGMQMVMFGDMYQLPPIVRDPREHQYFMDNHGGFYFFNARVWNDTELDIYELNHIFRQTDETFKDILNAIRTGDTSESILEQLNERVTTDIPEKGSVTIATTNNIVGAINGAHLQKLNDKVFLYKASTTGKFDPGSYPTDGELLLKKDAQVMMLRNDTEKRWVNGTIGFIKDLDKNSIKVEIDGKTHPVAKETWNKVRFKLNKEKGIVEEEVVSSFTQYPLRLSWAITIHKSQGQTYDSIVLDMGRGAFAHGQTYVALSRCKSQEGLYLKRAIRQQDIIVDPAIIGFMGGKKIWRPDLHSLK